MDNRSITRSPQNLYLPLLDLPQAIVAILNKIYKVQVRRCVRSVLRFKRIVRSNVIRERVGGHRGRVRAVLQLNADIAGDMSGNQDEDPVKKLADRGPALESNLTNDDSHALVLQAS